MKEIQAMIKNVCARLEKEEHKDTKVDDNVEKLEEREGSQVIPNGACPTGSE